MNMTTLEAIQFLIDNPDEMIKEARTDINSYGYAKIIDNAIMMCDNTGNILCPIAMTQATLKARWEVVKKPPKQVSWQEAIQSWISDDKDLKIVMPDGVVIIQSGSFRLGINLKDSNGSFLDCEGLDADTFTEGKWHILD